MQGSRAERCWRTAGEGVASYDGTWRPAGSTSLAVAGQALGEGGVGAVGEAREVAPRQRLGRALKDPRIWRPNFLRFEKIVRQRESMIARSVQAA